jgi:D-alanyl-D-alanine carboxypeptidase
MAAAGHTRPARADVLDLAAIRGIIRQNLARDSSGAVTAMFDMESGIADEVLLRATKNDALPDGYLPGDLVTVGGGQVIRRLIVDDTRALITAAADEGFRLYVGSGFRSQANQAAVFAAQTARWGDEAVANRYSARPGHSQHQLGTTIDFTTEFRDFRMSGAAEWLRAYAHEFGFVLPYTPAAVDHTGYVDEPWHARWLGHSLAATLASLGYQDWRDLDADDVVALVRAEAGLA